MICEKHGDVGELNINVAILGITKDEGVDYCLICFNEMLAKNCCVLKPAHVESDHEQQAAVINLPFGKRVDVVRQGDCCECENENNGFACRECIYDPELWATGRRNAFVARKRRV